MGQTTSQKKSKKSSIAKEDRRRKILSAALGIFAEKGFLKTTISDITSESGVPEASIYEHFSNKEGILFCLAEDFFSGIKSNLDIHFLGVEGAKNRFKKFVWHHLHYFQEHTDYGRVCILELLYNPRFYASAFSAVVQTYRNVLREIIQEGINEGVFDSMVDVDLGEIMVFGGMNHLILSKVVLNIPCDLIAEAEGIQGLFARAIAKDVNPNGKLFNGERGKRKAVLEAALNEFAKKGFQQTTISKIAKSARVTEPTIYEHFTNKEELLYFIPHAAAAEGGPFIHSVDQTLEHMNTPRRRLHTLIEHQIRSVREYPTYYYLLVTELRGNLGFYTSDHYDSMRQYTHRFNGIISEGIKQNAFRNDFDLGQIRDFYFGLIDELTLLLFVKNEVHQIVRYIENIYDLVHNAICTHPTSVTA